MIRVHSTGLICLTLVFSWVLLACGGATPPGTTDPSYSVISTAGQPNLPDANTHFVSKLSSTFNRSAHEFGAVHMFDIKTVDLNIKPMIDCWLMDQDGLPLEYFDHSISNEDQTFRVYYSTFEESPVLQCREEKLQYQLNNLRSTIVKEMFFWTYRFESNSSGGINVYLTPMEEIEVVVMFSFSDGSIDFYTADVGMEIMIPNIPPNWGIDLVLKHIQVYQAEAGVLKDRIIYPFSAYFGAAQVVGWL